MGLYVEGFRKPPVLSKNILLLIFLCASLIGCATSHVSVSQNLGLLRHKVHRIALMPSGGALVDAIGIELLNYGYEVVDTTTIAAYMAKDELDEVGLSMPQNLKKLSGDGIDALLVVREVGGYSGSPDSVSTRLISTADGLLIVGVAWQSMPHIGEQTYAIDINYSDAAKKIAEGLGNSLNQ